jgi:hypothetical protein
MCGRNLIRGLTSATSPRVDISSTCKVGQKFGVSLPLLRYSPSAWPSLLLYRRGRKSLRDLWITLYLCLNCCVFVRQSDSTHKLECHVWDLMKQGMNQLYHFWYICYTVCARTRGVVWFSQGYTTCIFLEREFVNLTKWILRILKQKSWMGSYTWICTTVYHPSCVGLFMFLWNTVGDGLSQKLGHPRSSWNYTTGVKKFKNVSSAGKIMPTVLGLILWGCYLWGRHWTLTAVAIHEEVWMFAFVHWLLPPGNMPEVLLSHENSRPHINMHTTEAFTKFVWKVLE